VRINREKLVDLARQETARRASADDDILAGFVIGSVATGDPLLGGTADVDLVLVHGSTPPVDREVIPLSSDVHLDIAHHPQSLYAHPPQLRVHPWFGPAVYEPVLVYDPQHFFERVQAGVRGQFQRPDHVIARARALLDRARQACGSLPAANAWLQTYTAAVLEAANAAACLAGPPAAGRRLALVLEQRALALAHPEILTGFGLLLGADRLPVPDMDRVLQMWSTAFDGASRVSSDPLCTTPRRSYYLAAFRALAEMGRPDAAVWPMLTTWDRAIARLNGSAPSDATEWQQLLRSLDLSSSASARRADELETYIDHMETILEGWAESNGA
jgi:hypothetical protein